jgi:UDP-N-acetylmuramate dehydrogenase
MDNNVSYQDELIKFEEGIQKDVNLSKYTSFKTGGNAEYLATPGRFSELLVVLEFADKNDLPITIIGGGSNILISDKGVKGIVLRTKHLSRFSTRGNVFSCRAGMSLDKAITMTLDDGMMGLEGLSGIQGSIGGAIAGNSGAKDSCINDHLLYVDYITYDGKTHRMSSQVINFGYRYSPFMDMRDCIIFEAGFLLNNSTANFKKCKEKQLQLKAERKEKGYFEYPSAGSIFKNPKNSKLTAGQMIDLCNLKAKRVGGAMISTNHANLIVNVENATSSDIFTLATLCRDAVKKKFDIELEYEIKLIGDFT